MTIRTFNGVMNSAKAVGVSPRTFRRLIEDLDIKPIVLGERGGGVLFFTRPQIEAIRSHVKATPKVLIDTEAHSS